MNLNWQCIADTTYRIPFYCVYILLAFAAIVGLCILVVTYRKAALAKRRELIEEGWLRTLLDFQDTLALIQTALIAATDVLSNIPADKCSPQQQSAHRLCIAAQKQLEDKISHHHLMFELGSSHS